MAERENAYLRHRQKMWLRPDARRWVRPDAVRYLKYGSEIASAFPALDRKYNANQPRVPAGSADGGQWTSGGGSGTGGDGNTAAVSPMGNIDFGNLPSFSDLFALFQPERV